MAAKQTWQVGGIYFNLSEVILGKSEALPLILDLLPTPYFVAAAYQ